MTWVMRPTLGLDMSFNLSLRIVARSGSFRTASGERVRAADDVEQFHGDLRLARPVVLAAQGLDHLLRGFGRRPSSPPSARFARRPRRRERPEEPDASHGGQQVIEQRAGFGAELVVHGLDLRPSGTLSGRGQGAEWSRAAACSRREAHVGDVDRRDLAVEKALDQRIGDRLDRSKRGASAISTVASSKGCLMKGSRRSLLAEDGHFGWRLCGVPRGQPRAERRMFEL